VTTDRIAYAAMRVAKLLSALSSAGEAIDRSGRGHIMEVYPEAALRCWKLSPALQSEDPGGYKGNRPAAIDRRKRLVDRVLEETADWLEVPGSVVAACLASDDDLDALLCALIAHAVDCGRAEPVSDLARAKAEGWIRLPLSEPLRELGRGRV
jgi:predicted RNase H-like nuclease